MSEMRAGAGATYSAMDISSLLDSEEMIAEYLTAAAEDGNPDVLLMAVAEIAKARGMAHVAKAAGLGRESLYKALAPGAHPRFETIVAVLRALGFTVVVRAPVKRKASERKHAARRASPKRELRAASCAFDPTSGRRDGRRRSPERFACALAGPAHASPVHGLRPRRRLSLWLAASIPPPSPALRAAPNHACRQSSARGRRAQPTTRRCDFRNEADDEKNVPLQPPRLR